MLYFCGEIKNKPLKATKMSEPMIVWCVIAGVLLLAFVIRDIEKSLNGRRRHSAHGAHHLFGMGKEREMFYIPGDVDDEDEFDD